MKVLYKPFEIVAGVIGNWIGENTFRTIWARIDSGAPPRPGTEDAPLSRVVAATALEAATRSAVAAAVDWAGMRWFHFVTGIWPGDKHDEEPGAEADEESDAASPADGG
jgi:hypothetical protein